MVEENFKIDALNALDEADLFQFINSNSDHLKYYFPKTLSDNSTLEKTKEYIVLKEKEISEKRNYVFIVRELKSDKIAGLIIIKKINWLTKQAELAYCVGSEFQGKRITTFAVAEIIKFCFDDLDIKIIQIIARKTNLGSIKVAINNGFIWQRTLKNEFTPINELPLDMELYELLNSNKSI